MDFGPYLGILKYTSIDAVTPGVLKFLLERVGITAPEDIIKLAYTASKSMMQEKGLKNLAELAQDPEFRDVIKSIMPHIQPAEEAEIVEEADATISTEAAIRCPHCSKPFLVHDAISAKLNLSPTF